MKQFALALLLFLFPVSAQAIDVTLTIEFDHSEEALLGIEDVAGAQLFKLDVDNVYREVDGAYVEFPGNVIEVVQTVAVAQYIFRYCDSHGWCDGPDSPVLLYPPADHYERHVMRHMRGW